MKSFSLDGTTQQQPDQQQLGESVLEGGVNDTGK